MTTRARFFKVAILFFRIGLDFRRESRLTRKMGFEGAEAAMKKRHEKRARELYGLAVQMEGVLIKLCQFLSARQDILPAPYIATLKGLQDEVPAKPFSDMERIINEDYAARGEIFASIDPVALASASLGQVHRAVLKSGEEVVLKILKPGIIDVIDLDFAILSLTFRLFSHFRFLRERFDFQRILDEFVRVTGDELNFKREAMIAARFRDAFKDSPHVVIPRVYVEYCTNRIIVMEYVPGDKVTEVDKWLSRNNDPVLLSRRLIAVYLEQFLVVKLIHFDPHPGNILVLSDSRLALLDFGMAGEITEAMSRGIQRAIAAVLGHDYETVVETLCDLGFLRRGADVNALLPVVAFFFDKVLSSMRLERGSLMAVDFSPIIDDLTEIVYTQPITLPIEWAYIGRTVGTLVGITSSLNPHINIVEELKPSFQKLMEQNFSQGIRTLVDRAQSYLKDLYFLPDRANSFIRRVEQGSLKFKFDQSDINATLNGLKTTVVRGVGIVLSFFSAFFAVLFLVLDKNAAGIFFIACCAGFLIFSLFLRRAPSREAIKKRIAS